MKFSIRDLMLVTVIVALATGWWADHAMLVHAQRQQVVVESLLKVDGTIHALYGEYQYTPPPAIEIGGLSLVIGRGQRVHGFSVRDEPSVFQRLLVPLFGEHAFVRVSEVYWDGEQLSDQDLHLLGQFSHLRELHLSGSNLSDAGLSQIALLRQLTVLDVSSTQITAGGLRHVEFCKELRELDLSGTRVEELDVQRLRKALPECVVKW